MVTQGQFFQAMHDLEEKLQHNHKSNRDQLDLQIERVMTAFEAHAIEDRALANRVLIVEVERGIEKATATRHGAIAGTIAAGIVLGGIESVKKLLGR